jgi:hypothetical protein
MTRDDKGRDRHAHETVSQKPAADQDFKDTLATGNGTRRTKRDMQTLRAALYEIVETNKPCSVRQVYYVGAGRLWEKDTGKSRKSYLDVARNLGVMRESGELPWGWLVDTGRYVRIDTMYDSITDALDRTHETYRRNLWATQPTRVEVWAESDSTSMLVEHVTRKLGVGLYSCKGQAGKEFAHSSAMAYLQIGKPVEILYLGDWDPSGLAIPRSLKERLRRYSGGQVDITMRRVAVTPEQIRAQNLQTHYVNRKDSSYPRFVAECRFVGLAEQDAVEVEAIAPAVLRQLIEDELYGLVADVESWNGTLAAEEHDLGMLADMAAAGWSV